MVLYTPHTRLKLTDKTFFYKKEDSKISYKEGKYIFWPKEPYKLSHLSKARIKVLCSYDGVQSIRVRAPKLNRKPENTELWRELCREYTPY